MVWPTDDLKDKMSKEELRAWLDKTQEKLEVMQDDVGNFGHALSDIWRTQRNAVVGRTVCCSAVKEDGSFEFVPVEPFLLVREFEMLSQALSEDERWSGHKVEPAKFMDAGCGVGNVLQFARTVFFTRNKMLFHGIEYDERTADRAEWFLNCEMNKDFKIIRGDILTFRNYVDYDIIYFYRPFYNYDLQDKFELYVREQMKVGAVLIIHGTGGCGIAEDKRFTDMELRPHGQYVSGRIYMKISDKEDPKWDHRNVKYHGQLGSVAHKRFLEYTSAER